MFIEPVITSGSPYISLTIYYYSLTRRLTVEEGTRILKTLQGKKRISYNRIILN